jgi:tetratricopeptide (TPR) repeat protein
MLGVVAIAGLLAAAVACRDTQPLVTTGVLAYLVLMLPESSLLPLSHAHMPYRPYPGMPFLFLAAASAAYTFGGARIATGLLALFVVASALASVMLNPVWRTSETLFTHAVEHGGGLQAHLNLAGSYPDRMDPRILVQLEQAMRLAPPSDTQARFKLGIQLVQTRTDVERGLRLLRTVASQRPDYSLYPFGLGEALAFVGRPQEGLPYIEQAIRQAPTLVEYRLRAASVALQLGQIDVARAQVDAVARIDPAYPGLAELRAQITR